MAPLRVGLEAGFQFRQAAMLGWAREESLVDIGRREPTDTPNDDSLVLFIPLQRGPRANPELPPNGRGNRDLALRGEA
jgi:hypothetical protein